MNAAAWIGILAAAAFFMVAYQALITRRVFKYPDSTFSQKAMQTALIWLVPLVGAAVVHAFFRLDASQPRPRDPAFTPEVGHDGGSDVGH